MTSDHFPEVSRELALTFQALLYAGGELEGVEKTAFETRLGEDQAAREALCQAIQLTHAQAGGEAPQPDPTYRERVHHQLRPRGGLWPWLTGKHLYRGHPLLWSALGAAAGFLLLFAVEHWAVPWGSAGAVRAAGQKDARPGSRSSKASAPSRAKKSAPPRRSTQAAAVADSAEANAWAELQTTLPWRKRVLSTGTKH
jgi:hypothetical protein